MLSHLALQDESQSNDNQLLTQTLPMSLDQLSDAPSFSNPFHIPPTSTPVLPPFFTHTPSPDLPPFFSHHTFSPDLPPIFADTFSPDLPSTFPVNPPMENSVTATNTIASMPDSANKISLAVETAGKLDAEIKSDPDYAVVATAKQPSVRPRSFSAVKFQLAVWDELWNSLLDEFGVNGLYYFRDTPAITHWKNVANLDVWEFVITEWLFALKGKAVLNCPPGFDPKSHWDFLGKPYVGQGSRFLRRDLRIWIKTGKTAGILRALDPATVPVHVVLSVKYLLAFEQSVADDTFPHRELSCLPPPGTDMAAEASRRINLIKSCYSQTHESTLGSVAYWKTVDAVQVLRRGTMQSAAQARRSAAASDSDDYEYATGKKKRRRVRASVTASAAARAPGGSGHAESTDISVPDGMIDEAVVELDRVVREARADPGIEGRQMLLNVQARSGKTIAKDFAVPASVTFQGLMEMLPLPNIPDDEMFICFVWDKAAPHPAATVTPPAANGDEAGKPIERVERCFDASQVVSRALGSKTAQPIIIKRGKRV